jgi:hypothetical protein
VLALELAEVLQDMWALSHDLGSVAAIELGPGQRFVDVRLE